MKIRVDRLPNRIVISRKGSDSSWGGSPSLIIGDEMISLPIPEHLKRQGTTNCNKHLKYSDLPRHKLISDFSSYLPKLKEQEQECVHLDPDIRVDLRPQVARQSGLSFGQASAAEGHLRANQIGENDLFLFFGWFRHHEQRGDRYQPKGPDLHSLWGWLQVEKKYNLDKLDCDDKILDEFIHHPHVCAMNKAGAISSSKYKKNSLYIAKKNLSFAAENSGAGVFKYSTARVLTQHCLVAQIDEPNLRTRWCLPRFFLETGLTYHPKLRTNYESCRNQSRIHIKAAGRGQEFIFPAKGKIPDLRKDLQIQVAEWLESIFA